MFASTSLLLSDDFAADDVADEAVEEAADVVVVPVVFAADAVLVEAEVEEVRVAEDFLLLPEVAAPSPVRQSR